MSRQHKPTSAPASASAAEASAAGEQAAAPDEAFVLLTQTVQLRRVMHAPGTVLLVFADEAARLIALGVAVSAEHQGEWPAPEGGEPSQDPA